MTPSILTWQAHGSPKVAGRKQSPAGGCYLCCGVTPFCVQLDKWMGDNFTSQTLARCPWAQHACEACAYVTSRVSPVLGRLPKDGKQFGGNFRNYSHCGDERGYFNASKGEKPLLREFVEREHAAPWFAAIADSGQKHVLPFARMNGPGRGGVALFDEQIVNVPEDVSLIADMTTLLTLGVTKDELASRLGVELARHQHLRPVQLDLPRSAPASRHWLHDPHGLHGDCSGGERGGLLPMCPVEARQNENSPANPVKGLTGRTSYRSGWWGLGWGVWLAELLSLTDAGALLLLGQYAAV